MKRLLFFPLSLFCCVAAMLAQNTVDTKIAVNSVQDDKTFVVIISNENYKHEESVPFARNDGEVFKVYCQKTLGIPDSNIRFLSDATLNEMKFELNWLDEALKAYDGEARAIIYYSGHGMPDESSKEAYLLPVDGYSKLPSSGLSTKYLYDQLGKMHTPSIMVFLDACFSGAKRDGKMLASSRGVAIRAKEEPVGSNTIVFSAAQGDETAYPYKSQNHGMFTYYVLDKIQQSGGATTLGELSDYVTKEVRRKSVVENGKSQTPSIVFSSNNENWRSWKLASKAAKKYEDRIVAQTAQESESVPYNTAAVDQSTNAFHVQSTMSLNNVEVVTNHPDFMVKVTRCVASEKSVIVDMTLTNNGSSAITDVYGFGGHRDIEYERSEAYDNEGNLYDDRHFKVKLANRKEYDFGSGTFNIPVKVPIKYSVCLEEVSPTAESISRLTLKFRCDAWGIDEHKPVMISNIPITRK